MASLLGDDNVIQYMKGDYAFFELSNKEPYVIRRIDEIFRTEENLIEVRCTKVYRIKDLSQSLQNIIEEKFKKRFLPLLSQERSGKFYDNDLAIAQIKEIFVSTECEQILLEKARGKCMAIVLSEAEDIYDYLHLPDVFFFYYTYDREAKVFGTDLKEPRIGIQYQAQNLPINEKKSDNNSKIIFNQIWRQNSIRDLDQLKDYLTIVRSVGILARSSDAVVQSKKISLDSIKSDSLRDTTIQTAFSILHSLNYDFWRATRYWVQGSSPVLIIDAKESWLNEEVTIFEEALEMHGKKFHYISKNILKWRSIKSIIDFYYMWKTTGRYLAQRLKSFHDPSSLKTKELKSCKVRKSTEKHSMRFDSGSSALYSTQAQVSSTAHSAGAESTR
ncbi:MAG: Metastasis-associated protein mta1, partial [Marteilia pararefringens]